MGVFRLYVCFVVVYRRGRFALNLGELVGEVGKSALRVIGVVNALRFDLLDHHHEEHEFCKAQIGAPVL